MKKLIKNIFKLLLLSSMTLGCGLFSGCNDGLLEQTDYGEKVYRISGKVEVDQNLAAQNEYSPQSVSAGGGTDSTAQKVASSARYATAATPTGIIYLIQPYSSKGVLNSEKSEVVSNYSYSVTLPNGSWYIKISAYDSSLISGEQTVEAVSQLTPFCSGKTETFTVDGEDVSISGTTELTLNSSSGTGYVNLGISAESATYAKSVVFKLNSSKSQTVNLNGNTTVYINLDSDSDGTGDSVSAGTYDSTLTFYDEADGNGNALITVSQTVQVYEGLTTDTWVGSAFTGTGVFVLPNALFAPRTDYYVDGASGSDSTGTGSKLHPFATIGKAVELIEKYNDGETVNIYLFRGGTGTNETSPISLSFYNSTTVNVKTVSDGDGYGIINQKTNDSSLFTIGDNCTLNLAPDDTYLQIKGNSKAVNYNGAFLRAYSSTAVVTLKNCMISGFISSEYGGAIFAGNQASVSVDSSFIGDSTASAVATSSSYGCKAAKGSAIYVESGSSLTLATTKIMHNFATGDGGAVYVAGDIKISGVNTIQYNGVSGSTNESNVLLGTEITMNVAGALYYPLTGTRTYSHIGISSEDTSYPVVLTSSYGVDNLDEDDNSVKLSPSKVFYSDDGTYFVDLNASNEAILDEHLYYYVSSSGLDTNDGTQAYPMATVQAAVNAIIAQKKTDSQFTIFLQSDITGTDAGITTDSTNGNSLISIAPESGTALKLKITSSDTTQRTIDAARTSSSTAGRVIYASSDVTLTLDNLVIKGGYDLDTAVGGGGLCVNGATVTISNCQFTGNSAKFGGGIYIAAGSTVDISDSTIGMLLSNATIQATSTSYANYAGNSGGGLYIIGASKSVAELTLSNVDFVYNYAGTSGGGIIMATNGFYKVEMSGGNIFYNTASQNAGGVSCYGKLSEANHVYFSGVKIHYNQALGSKSGTGNGGGIQLTNAQHIYLMNCDIQYNMASGSGGGIYTAGDSNYFILGTLSTTAADSNKTIIKNNTVNAESSNAYLGDMPIYIASDVSASEIYVTSNSSTYPVTITSGFKTNSTGTITDIFKSDVSKYKVQANSSGEAELYLSASGAGSIDSSVTEDVTCVLSSDTVNVSGGSGTTKLTVYLNKGQADEKDITDDITDWSVTFMIDGVTVDSTYASFEDKTVTLKNTIYDGAVVSVIISGKYNDVSYGGTLTVTVTN